MSRSQIEEQIGILWLILTVLLWQNDILGWWIVTLAIGILCQIESILFAYIDRLKKKLKKKSEVKK